MLNLLSQLLPSVGCKLVLEFIECAINEVAEDSTLLVSSLGAWLLSSPLTVTDAEKLASSCCTLVILNEGGCDLVNILCSRRTCLSLTIIAIFSPNSIAAGI